MDNLQERLAAADPVDPDELARVSSEPIFDELLASIVSVDDLPAGADVRGRRHGRAKVHTLGVDRHGPGHQGRVLVLTAAAACVAALIFVTVVQPAGNGPSRTAAPAWRLVGDTTSIWQTLPSSPSSADSFLACPSATTCYVDDVESDLAVDAIDVTHDSGTTWHWSALPVPVWAQVAPSCPDQDTCAVLGISANAAPGTPGSPTFLETTDGGASWSTEPGPSGLTIPEALAQLTCTSPTSCIAITSDPVGGAAAAFLTTDSGASWSTVALPEGFEPGALSCASATQCSAAGFYESQGGDVRSSGTVLVTSDGGASWSTASVPSGLGSDTQMSCAGSDCLATFFGPDGQGTQVLASSDGGSSWTAVAANGLPSESTTAVSCPAAGQCWSSGAIVPAGPPQLGGPVEPTVSSTSDGGQSWQQEQLPGGVGRVLDISCATTTSCYALAMLTPSGGGTGFGTTTTFPGLKKTSAGGSSEDTEVPVLLAYGS